MTNSYNIFRDDRGRLQVIPGPGGDLVVADFLRTDVGEHARHCDRVLDLLRRALAGGHAGQDDCIGNVYRLGVEGEQASLDNIHDDAAPGARLASRALLAIVEQWRSHLP